MKKVLSSSKKIITCQLCKTPASRRLIMLTCANVIGLARMEPFDMYDIDVELCYWIRHAKCWVPKKGFRMKGFRIQSNLISNNNAVKSHK